MLRESRSKSPNLRLKRDKSPCVGSAADVSGKSVTGLNPQDHTNLNNLIDQDRELADLNQEIEGQIRETSMENEKSEADQN